MIVSQPTKFHIWDKDVRWDTKRLLCWCCSLHPTWGNAFFFFPFGAAKIAKTILLFLEGALQHCPHRPSMSTCAWGKCFISNYHWQHDDSHSSFCCCLSESKNKRESKKETLIKSNSFFCRRYLHLKRRNDHYAWTFSFFWSDCICNHLFSWWAFFEALLVATRVIVVLIIVVAIIVMAVVAIALVALVIVMVILVMVPVVGTMATSAWRLSHFLLLWLFPFLELVKDTGRFFSSLALLKKAMIQRGFVGSTNLNWCIFGCMRKICSAFSCTMGNAIIQ